MTWSSHLLPILLLLSSALPARRADAIDLFVPSDFPTIQGAIDVAAAGDRVLVEPGTYFEQIDYLAKPIIVESTGGPEVTILDGSLLQDTIVFIGCGLEAVLRGFTLRNGGSFSTSPDVWGGGVHACGYATIEDNIFLDNVAQFGGALIVDNGNSCLIQSVIARNVFEGNQAWEGGAVYLDANNVRLEGNIFRDNIAIDVPPPPGFMPRGHGGAVFLDTGCEAIVRDNLFLGNSAVNLLDVGQGGAVYSLFGPNLFLVEGNSFISNSTQLSGSFLRASGPGVTFRNCLIWGNTNSNPNGFTENQDLALVASSVEYTLILGGFPGIGNIDADPALVYDAEGLPFLSHVATGHPIDSPCVDAGDPLSPIPAGGTTRLDAVEDTGALDIGFHHRPFSVPDFIRGDCGRDGSVDIADAILSLEAQFVAGSPAPSCADACDANDDGAVDIADPIRVLAALFAFGAPPPSPYPGCGADPTADGLGCAFDPICP